MESTVAVNVQEDVRNETRQLVTDCLGTPVILRKILQYFPNDELIQLSLVDKLWNYEARSVLRHRGNLIVKITSCHPCKDLKAFVSDLRAMSVVPFSGMKFERLACCYDIAECVASSLGTGPVPTYDEILTRMQWKSLSANFPTDYVRCWNCPGLLLLKLVIYCFSGDLENLVLGFQLNQKEFFQQVLQDSSFPRLKALRLSDTYQTASAEYTKSIKMLVSRAPNLQELHIDGRVDLMANFLEGSSTLLFTKKSVSPSVEDISDSVLDALRITRIKLKEIHEDLSLQRIKLITPMILQTSCESLSAMKIDAVFLAPIMCYGICLHNVISLQIHLNHLQPLRPRIRRLVKEFDFTRIFPSLTEAACVVYCYPNSLQAQIIQMIEPYYPTLKDPNLNRAVNITDLSLLFHPTIRARHCHAGILPEMFPYIETLVVDAARQDVIPSLIWKQHWKDLRELKVVKIGLCPPDNANLDSIFCGLFPEEVAELRGKDHEYLKAVNIVPVMPSIVCLQGLKNFTFFGNCWFYLGRPSGTTGPENAGAEMFSKVTGLVAFRRCPDLCVTLETDTEEAKTGLDHMKLYAKVVRL